jgi:hypothetical protein
MTHVDRGQVGMTRVAVDELSRNSQAHTYVLSAVLWVGVGS